MCQIQNPHFRDSESWIENEPENGTEDVIKCLSEDTRSVLIAEHAVDPYWLEMGWKIAGNRLVGFYRTRMGSYEGHISDWQTKQPLFFITSPPSELARHEHVYCFRPRGNGLYWVHFRRLYSDIDAGIIEIETVLAQALAGTHQKPESAILLAP